MIGLDINLSKSCIVRWGFNPEWIEEMSHELGCKVESSPITYLSIPLSMSCKQQKFCKSILENIESRVPIWKFKLLSKAGRAQLIKIVLNNVPSYYILVFKHPCSVANKIISIQIKFFWGHTDETNKLATVAWNQLEAPKDLRGLIFGSIIVKNIGIY